jgi:hypothetical protein
MTINNGVYSSTIIEDVATWCVPSPANAVVAFAYFYFNFNDSEKQLYERLICSLVEQLSMQSEKAAIYLDGLFSSS